MLVAIAFTPDCSLRYDAHTQTINPLIFCSKGKQIIHKQQERTNIVNEPSIKQQNQAQRNSTQLNDTTQHRHNTTDTYTVHSVKSQPATNKTMKSSFTTNTCTSTTIACNTAKDENNQIVEAAATTTAAASSLSNNTKRWAFVGIIVGAVMKSKPVAASEITPARTTNDYGDNRYDHQHGYCCTDELVLSSSSSLSSEYLVPTFQNASSDVGDGLNYSDEGTAMATATAMEQRLPTTIRMKVLEKAQDVPYFWH